MNKQDALKVIKTVKDDLCYPRLRVQKKNTIIMEILILALVYIMYCDAKEKGYLYNNKK